MEPLVKNTWPTSLTSLSDQILHAWKWLRDASGIVTEQYAAHLGAVAGGWQFVLYNILQYAGIELRAGDVSEIKMAGDGGANSAWLSANAGWGAFYVRCNEMRLGFADWGAYPGATPRAWKNTLGVNGAAAQVARSDVVCQSPNYDFGLEGSSDHCKLPKVVAEPTPGYYGYATGNPTMWAHVVGDKVPVRVDADTYARHDIIVGAGNRRGKKDNSETRPEYQVARTVEAKTITATDVTNGTNTIYCEVLR